MKFNVHIKRKHIKALLKLSPGKTAQDVFERALAIGLNALSKCDSCQRGVFHINCIALADAVIERGRS